MAQANHDASSASSGDRTISAFFYGTLMHGGILSRVIGRNGEELRLRDALLKDHTRHRVKRADYPAVVPASEGRSLINRELTEDEASVRGTLVHGLTRNDVDLLDTFEGDEYERRLVRVLPLSPPRKANDEESNEKRLQESTSSKIISSEQQSLENLEAHVYIWIGGLDKLSPELWSYEEFLRDKLHRWVGGPPGGESDPNSGEENEYAEVDRRRAMNGKIVSSEQKGDEGVLPIFGHRVRDEFWSFEKGYTNLNHGSYGAPPKPVIKAFRDLQDQAESRPDPFFRRDYMTKLNSLRERLAKFVNCDTDELVLVPNVSAAVSATLITMVFPPHSCILYFGKTIYGACGNNLKFTVDRHAALGIPLELVNVPIEYPVGDDEIYSIAKKTIEDTHSKGKKIYLGFIDAISSNPGVVFPSRRISKLFRENGILSFVDAAHAIGQVPVDLKGDHEKGEGPDFWISNCHKWLMAHRGCAVFYASKRLQHLSHAIPVGWGYSGPRKPIASAVGSTTENVGTAKPIETIGPSPFEEEWVWTGTQDWSPVLSIDAALDFRETCGGEERIRIYCHGLAVKGGQRMAEILGTEVMENQEGTLTASMVNVRMPIETPSPDRWGDVADKLNNMMWARSFYVAVFIHAGKVWTRASAQIYNELKDFEEVANHLSDICRELRQ